MGINLDQYFTKSDTLKPLFGAAFFVSISFKCYNPRPHSAACATAHSRSRARPQSPHGESNPHLDPAAVVQGGVNQLGAGARFPNGMLKLCPQLCINKLYGVGKFV